MQGGKERLWRIENDPVKQHQRRYARAQEASQFDGNPTGMRQRDRNNQLRTTGFNHRQRVIEQFLSAKILEGSFGMAVSAPVQRQDAAVMRAKLIHPAKRLPGGAPAGQKNQGRLAPA